MAETGSPVTLFYSYAHEDEALRDELAGHLKILERRGLVRAWHDRRIVPGQDWEAAIDTHLDSADLVLLLVSKDFIGSDYIFGVELRRAMARQAAQACEVVPIIVRAVNIEPEDADDLAFMRLQCLPADLKPVTSWPNRDEAWTHVAKGLRACVNGIRARRATPAAAPALRHAAAPADTPAEDDAVLDAVVAGVVQQVDAAEQARGHPPVAAAQREQLARDTRRLIDLPEQQRVLWVDDRPQGNRHEIAALAKLQIETVTARSTDEAMARIAADAAAGERFDLVLTDWSRAGEPADAALVLLARLRAAGHAMPVLLYHAMFDPARRAERARRALAAGASADAVLPAELMRAVLQALQGPAAAS